MFSVSRILCTSVVAISVLLPASGTAQSNNSTGAGAVFAMTNAADKNEIIAYKRGADGSLQEDWMVARVPIGRLATTEEIARCVRYLAGDDASLISGAAIPVYGRA